MGEGVRGRIKMVQRLFFYGVHMHGGRVAVDQGPELAVFVHTHLALAAGVRLHLAFIGAELALDVLAQHDVV